MPKAVQTHALRNRLDMLATVHEQADKLPFGGQPSRADRLATIPRRWQSAFIRLPRPSSTSAVNWTPENFSTSRPSVRSATYPSCRRTTKSLRLDSRALSRSSRFAKPLTKSKQDGRPKTIYPNINSR